MSTTSSVTSTTSSSSSSSSASAYSSLDEGDFMTLLIEELKNQDPTDPVDNKETLAQLAQFSQLSAINGLSDKIDNMVTSTNSSNQLTAAQLVGKVVAFDADQIGLTAGSTTTFNVVMGSAATSSTAVISDSTGKVVRTLDLGAMAAGTSAVTWDGLDSSGSSCASGQYYLTVSGTAADGSTVKASANVQATVTGVSYADDAVKLIVAGQQITLDQVTAVYPAPSSSGT